MAEPEKHAASEAEKHNSAAAKKKEEPKSYAKRDALRTIEKQVQERWERERIFEADASETATEGKFMATFPFPYMNGVLHMGHSFTVSKADFAVAYQRLKGKRVLFPFGFHVTGMPIKACADKLQREMAEFGTPPVFPKPPPVEDEEEETKKHCGKEHGTKGAESAAAKEEPEKAAAATTAAATTAGGGGGKAEKGKPAKVDPTAHHSAKAKTKQKSLGPARQWTIMTSMNVPEQLIPKFADAHFWCHYFPPIVKEDLKALGTGIDWRRSFVTTDMNPYYDSFVRWQFETLRKLEKIQFGKRYTIWSPSDGQPCADHDRASGEGVLPQEYTGIKLELLEPYPEKLRSLSGGGKRVYFVAATLRPETMFGQTNCWVGPEVKYGAFEMSESEVFLCTERSARNFSYQSTEKHSFGKQFGKPKKLLDFIGTDVIGAAVKAPLSTYERVYILPMMTVCATKGTGVVTCVPSDSPDDYAAFRDLRDKAGLRKKYSIRDEMVLPFQPIPIIRTTEFGELSAKACVEQLKIQSQNDRDLLEQAHVRVYKAGFYDGVMLVGEVAGKKVQDAKGIVRDLLLRTGQAVPYAEPESLVMSRSGDECVVALTDQWYLNYGESQWRDITTKALTQMNTYSDETRNMLTATLSWLNQWACSRTYGLGSRLPWDRQFLIESLSDSTIYMAYYTVAQFLHTDIYGQTPGPAGIRPEQLTNAVWNYLFLSGSYPAECGIAESTLAGMRKEFEYWYPFDVRVSGKELIQNHLTFCLYNHTAIFPPSKWPRSIRTNGHLLLDCEKMSKSTGNFLTLREGIEKYSADGVRMALADAGDSMDDANFVSDFANAAILRLYTFLEWTEEILAVRSRMRSSGEHSLWDRIFLAQTNLRIRQTEENFERTLYKEALRTGYFEMQSARDQYRVAVGSDENMHRDLIDHWLETQLLLLAPFCPHVCEHLWTKIGKSGSVLRAKYPSVGDVDEMVLRKSSYLDAAMADFRSKLKSALHASTRKGTVAAVAPSEAVVFYSLNYPAWHEKVLLKLKEIYEREGKLPEAKDVAAAFKSDAELVKVIKKIIPLVEELKEEVRSRGVSAFDARSPFDEATLLQSVSDYITRTLDLRSVRIESAQDPAVVDVDGRKAQALPGRPAIGFVIAHSAAAATATPSDGGAAKKEESEKEKKKGKDEKVAQQKKS